MLVGFICERTEEPISFSECLECSRIQHPCPFWDTVLQALIENNADRPGAGLSATMLTGCLRQTYFNLTLDYYQKPSKLWPALRGTMIHSMLEKVKLPNKLIEVRLGYKIDGMEITGKPDEYDIGRKMIIDYKSKPKGKVPKVAPDYYTEQLNIYRLLVEDGYDIKTLEPVNGKVESLGLIFLTDMENIKMPVTMLDKKDVLEVLTYKVDIIDQALHNNKLPVNRDDPSKSKFCKEWCPHVKDCASS